MGNMIKKIYHKFGMVENEVLVFGNKKLAGLWLIIIGLVIILAAAVGGKMFGMDFVINPFVITFGFGLGILIISNKLVKQKLTLVEQSIFQVKTANLGDMSLFILMFIFASPFWPSLNFQYIWLATFLAVGVHFILFYFSIGPSMLLLALLTVVNAIIGLVLVKNVVITALVDGVIKLSFGIHLMFFSKVTQKLMQSMGSSQNGVRHDV